jgi:hypothetical protein
MLVMIIIFAQTQRHDQSFAKTSSSLSKKCQFFAMKLAPGCVADFKNLFTVHQLQILVNEFLLPVLKPNIRNYARPFQRFKKYIFAERNDLAFIDSDVQFGNSYLKNSQCRWTKNRLISHL